METLVSEPSSADSLRAGMQAGPWVIERELGRGGMGIVYAVRHAQIGKRAALKVMNRRLLQPKVQAKRMELEARVVNEIGHPNIVDIFDVGTTEDGRPYIVMEQLVGHALSDCELDIEDAIAILIQVSNALIAAHAAGVVHRDLKPDNIFLAERPGEPPRVVILDWGIARILTADARQTQEGELLGTPQYIAPEQARGESVTPKTDVYSLGVVAYQLALLQPPFDADTPRDIMAMHLFVPPPPPRTLWPEIPPRLECLLRDMLAKEAAARPGMEEVAARLAVIADDLHDRHHPEPAAPTRVETAAPVTKRRRSRRSARQWPVVIGVLAAAALAALVLPGLMTRRATTRSNDIIEPPPAKVIESDQPAEPSTPELEPSVFANPVLEDCADPAVTRVGPRWYMTCTGGRGGNIYPIYESANLGAWRRVAWIFPSGERPTWGDGHDWSPELHAIPDGFAAYFTMRATGGRNAIGLATAKSVTGPYRDDGLPLVAPPAGASDPHVFEDRGRRYLYFKSEDASPSIQVQVLTDDGRAVAGDPRRLLVADAREHDNIEAPWVIREGDYVYLFYSSARYCDADYDVRVARSRSPLGPFEKRPQPILSGGAAWAAPGHVAVTEGPARERFLVYHAYRIAEGMPSCDGDHESRRHVRIDALRFEDGWPVARPGL